MRRRDRALSNRSGVWTLNIEQKKRDLADAEAFVKDIQGEHYGSAYKTVYPFGLEDLRNARRYVRTLQADIRKYEAQRS